MQFVPVIKTATCSGSGVPSSGSCTTKK